MCHSRWRREFNHFFQFYEKETEKENVAHQPNSQVTFNDLKKRGTQNLNINHFKNLYIPFSPSNQCQFTYARFAHILFIFLATYCVVAIAQWQVILNFFECLWYIWRKVWRHFIFNMLIKMKNNFIITFVDRMKMVDICCAYSRVSAIEKKKHEIKSNCSKNFTVAHI